MMLAQNSLGYVYSEGEGVEKDAAQAVHWYQKAAEQGHAEAQHNLGTMYWRGEGVEQDRGKVAIWKQKVANQGDTKDHVMLSRGHYQSLNRALSGRAGSRNRRCL
jgi:TPR repeat protein